MRRPVHGDSHADIPSIGKASGVVYDDKIYAHATKACSKGLWGILKDAFPESWGLHDSTSSSRTRRRQPADPAIEVRIRGVAPHLPDGFPATIKGASDAATMALSPRD